MMLNYTFFCWIPEIIQEMNIVLLVIGLCSVLGVAVFIERLIYLSRVDGDTDLLLVELKYAIERGNIADAMAICEKHTGAVASIIRAGISHHEREKADIQHTMEIRGMVEIAKMERHAKILSIIANIAPLIGLLGTVLGFIQAFGEMRMSSLVEISATQIGAAMEYALVTTAAGLVVAIPAVIAYNYIVTKIESMTIEMKAVSSEVIDLLTQHKDVYK